jgi:peptidoglycan/LPS O-acetylase OafA/YrhL
MVVMERAPSRRTIGDAYSGRTNGLNLVRLLLALTVVVSHSIVLGGYGSEDFFHWSTAGLLAVFGFFGISGYLIAASADTHSVGRFMWHRFIRIFPAFWVCLIAVAFVFGPLEWLHSSDPCGLSCYVRGPLGPLGYIFHNALLWIGQPAIAEPVRNPIFGWIPYPALTNGSLWTLFYEFLCYLLVGALAVVGALRKPSIVVALTAMAWLAVSVITLVPMLNVQFDLFHRVTEFRLLLLVPVFLVGSVLYLYRSSIPDSGWLALSCIALMAISILVPVGGNGVPEYALTRGDIAAPLIAYPMLWLGAHVPWPQICARNDYSYGVYIYAYPVAGLLSLWGINRWGYVPYTVLTVVVVAPLAVASWWIVEKRSLRLRNVNAAERRRTTRTTMH